VHLGGEGSWVERISRRAETPAAAAEFRAQDAEVGSSPCVKVGLRGGDIHAISRGRPGFPHHAAPIWMALFRSGEGTTMLQKRDDETRDRTGEMAALETARSAAESSGKAAEAKPEEERVSMFWRIFGGTILSIVGLVTITLYNNLTSSI